MFPLLLPLFTLLFVKGCKCFLNTKFQVQLDYSIPSAVIDFDKTIKYTNITIGKDSFLCVLNKSDDHEREKCNDYEQFQNVKENELYGYVEKKLQENYLLKYLDQDQIHSKFRRVQEEEEEEDKAEIQKQDEEIVIQKNKHSNKNKKDKEKGKIKGSKKVVNHSNELNHNFKCSYNKMYDYIFHKYKFNVYHKNRIYDKINDYVKLKNHIIKGKMLTIQNKCFDMIRDGDLLKICLNKSITYITKSNHKMYRKHVAVTNYMKGKDLLFANNTVVQYYSDGKYLFEVLLVCGNNNLKIDRFEPLYKEYFPQIFQIYQRIHMNIPKWLEIQKEKGKYKEQSFMKSFNRFEYTFHYYNSLKNKLNELLNSYLVGVTHMYRITLSAFMFCNYTDEINPPLHFLLRNAMNHCYSYKKNDDYFYEVCFPLSIIKYKKDSFGNPKSPLILLGASYVSSNEGTAFFEKTYEAFPVLKQDYFKKKNKNETKGKPTNSVFNFSFSSDSSNNDSEKTNFSFSTFTNQRLDNTNKDYFPYLHVYMIDRPMEILKYGNEAFYKALAIDFKGAKCKDSLDEIHDYITTVYFDCSLHFSTDYTTKVLNIFQSTECHYYVHISSPDLCSHPTLHTVVQSKNEIIKCFKNVHAASAQMYTVTEEKQNSKDIYNYRNIINDYKEQYTNEIKLMSSHPMTEEEKDQEHTQGNDTEREEDHFMNDHYIKNLDKFQLIEFYNLKKKIAENKHLMYLEALPKDINLEFGNTYNFGLGKYIRKRIYKTKPLFHIGNVVSHKYWNYHAVVISWDFICYAPNKWKENVFSEYPSKFQNYVHYLLLISTNKEKNKGDQSREIIKNTHMKRDQIDKEEEEIHKNEENKMDMKTNEYFENSFHFAYVPESSLIYSDRMVYSEYLLNFFEKYNHFFHFYIPKKDHMIWKLFPYDFFNLV